MYKEIEHHFAYEYLNIIDRSRIIPFVQALDFFIGNLTSKHNLTDPIRRLIFISTNKINLTSDKN